MGHLGLVWRRTTVDLIASEDGALGGEFQTLVAIETDPFEPSDDFVFAVDGVRVARAAVLVVALKTHKSLKGWPQHRLLQL